MKSSKETINRTNQKHHNAERKTEERNILFLEVEDEVEEEERERENENKIRQMESSREEMVRRVSNEIGLLHEKVTRTKTLFCKVIGYHGSAVEDVENEFKRRWDLRGERRNKEDLKLSTAIAGSGHGKTELCRQLVVQLPEKLENVQKSERKMYTSFFRSRNCLEQRKSIRSRKGTSNMVEVSSYLQH